MSGKGFVPAGGLAVGNAIVTRAGPALRVRSIKWQCRSEGYTVYNFEVEASSESEDTHNYFVGRTSGGILVHNPEGTYFLVDPETNQIVRTGRTNDLVRRQREHGNDPVLKAFEFWKDMDIPNNYAALRGREQIIHDAINGPFDKINPISPLNPRRAHYLREGAKLGVGPLGF